MMMMMMSHLQVGIWPSTHLLQQLALELLSTCRHHHHHHKHYGRQDHHCHPHAHDEEPANGASPNKCGAPASDSGRGVWQKCRQIPTIETSINCYFVSTFNHYQKFSCFTCRDSCPAYRPAPPLVWTRLLMPKQELQCRGPASSCSMTGAATPW